MHQQTNRRRINISDPIGSIERGRLSFRLFRDPRVPTWVKAALPVIAALYLVLPIDLIPDFILGLGQIDDLSVLGVMIFAMTKLLPKLAPEEVVGEHLSDIRTGRRWSRRNDDSMVDVAFTVADEREADSNQRRSNNAWGNRA
jgi:uncharacterized membrane protein YkvA (DUF1232 family)